MARDQDRRDEYAAEHGYDTYNDFRNARDALREEMELRGVEVDWRDANTLLDFQNDYDPEMDDWSYDELKDWYYENIGEDEAAFHAWLHEMYG